MAKTRKRLTLKQRKAKKRDRLTLLFKKRGIPIDLILKDLIKTYIEIYFTTISIKKKIDEIGLMYEYTNKAGETNQTKNPMVSEYKQYCEQLNKTIISMTKYIGLYRNLNLGSGSDPGGDGQDENELNDYFERHTPK